MTKIDDIAVGTCKVVLLKIWPRVCKTLVVPLLVNRLLFTNCLTELQIVFSENGWTWQVSDLENREKEISVRQKMTPTNTGKTGT